MAGGRYYCFNPECEGWGESHVRKAYGHTLLGIFKPGTLINACDLCGHDMYFHDTWDGDERRSDDGSHPEY